ncbi:hypothetical protein CBS101457_000805 [Exobasidium rhododendri]|nr:hypothetical protein CBS101457_000805 [Exobasidium rhododendri]
MAAKRPQGAGQSGAQSNAAPPATHIYASSIAVPIQSNIAHLESRLNQLSQQISSFLQRDVVLSRIDDTNPQRVELEASDSSFAPIRRARVQSRLHVRFQNHKTDLRVYSQGGSGAYKDSNLVNIRSLISVSLENGDAQEEDDYDNEVNDYGEDSNGEAATLHQGIAAEQGEMLPDEIDAGRSHWRQITLAMGWIPHHTVVRSGHCFTIRHDTTLLVEVFLFHLLKFNEDTKPVTLQRLSNTRVLQAVVTITLPGKGESGSVDLAKLSERAHEHIVKLQESLRGLVDLSRDID